MKDAHVYSHYRQALIGSIVDLAADHKDIVFLDALGTGWSRGTARCSYGKTHSAPPRQLRCA